MVFSFSFSFGLLFLGRFFFPFPSDFLALERPSELIVRLPHLIVVGGFLFVSRLLPARSYRSDSSLKKKSPS